MCVAYFQLTPQYTAGLCCNQLAGERRSMPMEIRSMLANTVRDAHNVSGKVIGREYCGYCCTCSLYTHVHVYAHYMHTLVTYSHVQFKFECRQNSHILNSDKGDKPKHCTLHVFMGNLLKERVSYNIHRCNPRPSSKPLGMCLTICML